MKIDNFMAWFFSKHTQHIKGEIVGLTIFSTITWAYKLWIIMDFPKDYFAQHTQKHTLFFLTNRKGPFLDMLLTGSVNIPGILQLSSSELKCTCCKGLRPGHNRKPAMHELLQVVVLWSRTTNWTAEAPNANNRAAPAAMAEWELQRCPSDEQPATTEPNNTSAPALRVLRALLPLRSVQVKAFAVVRPQHIHLLSSLVVSALGALIVTSFGQLSPWGGLQKKGS